MIPPNSLVTQMRQEKQPPDCIACTVDGERYLWYSPFAFATFCHNQPRHKKVLSNPTSTYLPHSFYHKCFLYSIGIEEGYDVDKLVAALGNLSRTLHRSTNLFQ